MLSSSCRYGMVRHLVLTLRKELMERKPVQQALLMPECWLIPRPVQLDLDSSFRYRAAQHLVMLR